MECLLAANPYVSRCGDVQLGGGGGPGGPRAARRSKKRWWGVNNDNVRVVGPCGSGSWKEGGGARVLVGARAEAAERRVASGVVEAM